MKAGDDLTLDEMRDLIRQLELCDLARTCAHGRPTVVRLSQAQLEKEFGRQDHRKIPKRIGEHGL